jgi:hypothetical protein
MWLAICGLILTISITILCIIKGIYYYEHTDNTDMVMFCYIIGMLSAVLGSFCLLAI